MTNENQEPVEGQESADQVEDQATFPRKYVEELRAESAKHRTAAKDAQDLLDQVQRRLFDALVSQAGILADPTDLPFDANLLDQENGVIDAINALVEAKPHLRSRRVQGDIGQGSGTAPANPQEVLGGLLRAAA